MIVDASAIMAIILGEPGSDRLAAALADAEQSGTFAVSWFEAAMVAETRGGPTTAAKFDRMIEIEGIQIVEFTPKHALLAREAWQRYGKGRHKAALNFGDCMTYALAKNLGEKLLFKGDGFSQTDIEPALKN